ncbi:hypothetical protein NDU88_007877 [Pleurodeles waltl]|uniref:Uncharacterized protein n=1 Tax=Pleurodeles waltl TaxID=8319 RepID=A0AAV7NX94_PLEWA|nr:hypothetical protein NDU88_007877 [Pleurodeles waltl]
MCHVPTRGHQCARCSPVDHLRIDYQSRIVSPPGRISAPRVSSNGQRRSGHLKPRPRAHPNYCGVQEGLHTWFPGLQEHPAQVRPAQAIRTEVGPGASFRQLGSARSPRPCSLSALEQFVWDVSSRPHCFDLGLAPPQLTGRMASTGPQGAHSTTVSAPGPLRVTVPLQGCSNCHVLRCMSLCSQASRNTSGPVAAPPQHVHVLPLPHNLRNLQCTGPRLSALHTTGPLQPPASFPAASPCCWACECLRAAQQPGRPARPLLPVFSSTGAQGQWSSPSRLPAPTPVKAHPAVPVCYGWL